MLSNRALWLGCGLVLSVTGCVSIQPPPANFPLSGYPCNAPIGNMDSLDFHLTQNVAGVVTEYLVAIKRDQEGTVLYLLSPQMLPLMNITCDAKSLKVSHQIIDKRLLGARVLLGYILIALAQDNELKEILRAMWSLTPSSGGQFMMLERASGRSLTVERKGGVINGDWYIAIADELNVIVLEQIGFSNEFPN